MVRFGSRRIGNCASGRLDELRRAAYPRATLIGSFCGTNKKRFQINQNAEHIVIGCCGVRFVK
jgi:hypothetical protein